MSKLLWPDGGVQRSEPYVDEPSSLRNFDRERRDIDPDHLVTSALEMQADPSGAAAEIEHTPAHESHRAALLQPPAPKRREIEAGVVREDAAIVTFDDLDRLTPVEQIAQQVAEGVFSRREDGAQQRERA